MVAPTGILLPEIVRSHRGKRVGRTCCIRNQHLTVEICWLIDLRRLEVIFSDIWWMMNQGDT
ncbi:hypothetical protein SCA6_005074 [Theobroma cacao]